MDAKYIKSLLNRFVEVIQGNRGFLTGQDGVVGDGDLGLTMSDGFQAIVEAVYRNDEAGADKPLYMTGKTMSVAAPSTMGTLMASKFIQTGEALKGICELDLDHIARFFQAYEAGVVHRGEANINEEAFLNGIDPAIQNMRSSPENRESLEGFVQRAYEATYAGYENTATMLAVHGRTATRREMSRSLKDPGACVAMLMVKAFVRSVK